MKTIEILSLSLVLLEYDLPAVAAEQQVNRSTGKLKQNQDTGLSQVLQTPIANTTIKEQDLK